MTMDELLAEIRQRRLILINEREIRPVPGYTQDIKRTMRKHRQGLALLVPRDPSRHVRIVICIENIGATLDLVALCVTCARG